MKQERSTTIDTDKAWNDLKSRFIQDGLIPLSGDRHRGTNFRMVFRYAAAALILIGLGSGIFFTWLEIQRSSHTITFETTAKSRTTNMYLPDGSLASLNFNSKLDYPDTFMEDERVVHVSGEVYFDVKSVVNQPFIVNTRQARIEVMGTEFNVNTKGTGNHLEVLVKSGKVKLSKTDDPDQNIVIEPGYIGVLRNNTLEKRLNRDENYLAWTTGELIFKGHKLETVSSTLMKTYGITIEIADPEISSYRITTSFHGESIDTVLSVIVSTFNLNLEKKHDTEYIISGNSR